MDIKTKVVHDRNNQYIITISKSEIQKVKDILQDHMYSSMFYKIDLDKNISHNFDYNNIHLFNKSAIYYGNILDQDIK